MHERVDSVLHDQWMAFADHSVMMTSRSRVWDELSLLLVIPCIAVAIHVIRRSFQLSCVVESHG